MTDKVDLEWYISNGELKADSNDGSYIVASNGDRGFGCQFHPYPIDLTPSTCSLIDCLKACEEYHTDLADGVDPKSLKAKLTL